MTAPDIVLIIKAIGAVLVSLGIILLVILFFVPDELLAFIHALRGDDREDK